MKQLFKRFLIEIGNTVLKKEQYLMIQRGDTKEIYFAVEGNPFVCYIRQYRLSDFDNTFSKQFSKQHLLIIRFAYRDPETLEDVFNKVDFTTKIQFRVLVIIKNLILEELKHYDCPFVIFSAKKEEAVPEKTQKELEKIYHARRTVYSSLAETTSKKEHYTLKTFEDTDYTTYFLFKNKVKLSKSQLAEVERIILEKEKKQKFGKSK